MPHSPIDTSMVGVWFDPKTFRSTVAGVAYAHDQMSAIVVANPAQPSTPLEDFGDIGADLFKFNEKWSHDAACADRALLELVCTLPLAGTSLETADSDGGAGIARIDDFSDGWIPEQYAGQAIPDLNAPINNPPSGTPNSDASSSPDTDSSSAYSEPQPDTQYERY